jgi:hypothetical protein
VTSSQFNDLTISTSKFSAVINPSESESEYRSAPSGTSKS